MRFRDLLYATACASLLAGAARAEEAVVLHERFQDNARGWWVGDEEHGRASVEKGRLRLERRKPNGWASWISARIHQEDDYRLEATLRIVEDQDDFGCGLWFGARDGENGFVFEVGALGQYRFFHYAAGQWVDETGWQKSEHVRPGLGAKNALSVRKQGRRWLLYVNGQYVDRVPARQFFGQNLGLRVEGQMSCELEELRVVERVPPDLATGRRSGGPGLAGVFGALSTRPEKPPRLAVLPAEDVAGLLRPEDLPALADFLEGCLAAQGAYHPVPREKLKLRPAETCRDPACRAAAARAAGAEAYLSTKLLRLGDVCALSLTVVDVKREVPLGGGVSDMDCSTLGVLQALRQVVEQL
jgi:hypothetical protein